MIIFIPSVPIYYLIQPLFQNKWERICIPFQLGSKGNCKMTTLFLSHVCDIPYDTYVRKPILFRDTLINVSSLMSFFFSQTIRQGNNVTHSLESKTFFSFISLDGDGSIKCWCFSFCWFSSFLINFQVWSFSSKKKKKKHIKEQKNLCLVTSFVILLKKQKYKMIVKKFSNFFIFLFVKSFSKNIF